MCRYNVIWPSQGFVCVTVCSLNCLNQFLKYKIGYTCGVCVCVCVCALNIFVERWFWELKMLTGSLFELYAWLHSYLCFSLLEKWFLSYLNTSSISPRHLAICRALMLCSYRNLDRSSTTRWIDRESSWTFDSLSTASGLIELLFLCLCFVSRHLLDSCICRRCVSRHISWQMSRHLSTPLSVENYWGSIYRFFAIWFSFPRSLSIYLCLFTSRTLSSPSKPSTHVIFGLSLLQITWYMFLFSHFSCISCI